MLSFCPNCCKRRRECKCDLKDNLPLGMAAALRSAPPLVITQAGFTKHGKTSFTAVVTVMLERIGLAFPDVVFDMLGDPSTMERVQKMRRGARDPEHRPEGTQESAPPLYLGLRDSGRGTPLARTIFLYDTRGEDYCKLQTVADGIPSLPHSDVIWLCISPMNEAEHAADKESQQLFSVADLYENYRHAMRLAKKRIADQKIVVVLTKADVWKRDLLELELPDVLQHLADDPLRNLLLDNFESPTDLDLSRYVAEVKAVSRRLQKFVAARVLGGQRLIDLARQDGADLHFCAVSATGQEIAHGNLIEKTPRFRVLDPLFLSLDIGRPRRSIRLIVDGSSDGTTGADSWDALRVHCRGLSDKLSHHGEVFFHFVGHARPSDSLDIVQRESSHHYPALIGPILDSLPYDSHVLVLSRRRLLDLADFVRSPWRDRVLQCVFDHRRTDDWAHSIVLHESIEYDRVVDQLFRLRGA